MTPTELRRIALSFPETHEEPHFERASFRVGKKIFATLTADGREAMVRVADTDAIETLLSAHPKIFFSYGTWTTRNGALGVRLPEVQAKLMKELMSTAWKNIAPKRVVAGLAVAPPAGVRKKKSKRPAGGKRTQ